MGVAVYAKVSLLKYHRLQYELRREGPHSYEPSR